MSALQLRHATAAPKDVPKQTLIWVEWCVISKEAVTRWASDTEYVSIV